jgi:hypothetical protein
MPNGSKISKDKARKWVKKYNQKHEKDPNFLSSILFDKSLVLDLLNEPNCAGLRIYNAEADDDRLHFVLVGVDANGNNLLPAEEATTSGSYSLLDDGQRCPGQPGCPKEF